MQRIAIRTDRPEKKSRSPTTSMDDWPPAPALLSILLAGEDDASLLGMATALLNAGHVVHTVHQADLVVDAVRRYKPDVCVMRIGMPGRSCDAVAEELRRGPPSRRPFLVGVPGSPRAVGEQRLAQVAAFDHLFDQPVDPTALLAFIDGIGTRRRTKKR